MELKSPLILGQATSPSARMQGGSVLLLSLIVLLLMFLGALFTLRGVLTDTALTDSFSERQKDVQASDLALQWAVSQIKPLMPLEINASGKTWWRDVLPTQAQQPDLAYWNICMTHPVGTTTCAQATMPNGTPQSAWWFAQPTGLTGGYYDIWVHTIDARGHVSTDTESVYKSQ